MFFAGPERRMTDRARQVPFWHIRRVLFGSVFTIGLNCALRSCILQE